MLRPSPNHGTQWLPNDDDVTYKLTSIKFQYILFQLDTVFIVNLLCICITENVSELE